MNNFFYIREYNPYFFETKKAYTKNDGDYFVVDLKNSPVKYKSHHDIYLKQIQWIKI